MQPTWEKYDRPVLAAAIQYIEDHNWTLMPQAFDLADIVGLESDDVGKALLRLDGEYIDAQRNLGGLRHIGVARIHPSARRAAGQWPSPADIADEVIAGMITAAENEEDSEKRGKLKQAALFFGSSGKDLFINLLATVIAKSTGLD